MWKSPKVMTVPPLVKPTSAKPLVLSMMHPMEPMESTRPETTRRSSTVLDPTRNVIPLVASPTMDAKCRGGINDISINDGKKCGTRRRWRSRGIG